MLVPALCPGDKAGDCEIALGAPASLTAALSSAPSLLLCVLVTSAHLRSSGVSPVSRSIITCIAAANMVASLGYLMGSINYQLHRNTVGYTAECSERFVPVCQLQSFVTSMGMTMSLLWTSILAIQLYQSVVKGRVHLERRVMLLCHVVGWGVPTLVSFGLLAGRQLGYSTVTATGWCLVADVNEDTSLKPKWEIALFVFIGGMFVELCTYVIVVICAVLAGCHREQPLSPSHLHTGPSEQLTDKQLLIVPVMVVILRCWGTMYTLGSLILLEANSSTQCVDSADITRSLFSILGILQAIGDPGALGWGTILLYVLRSPKVRGQLWNDALQCLTCCGLGTRCMYRGRRPGVDTYMYRDARRVSTVIYTQARTTPTRPPSTSPMRNAGRFREGVTDSVNTDSN